MNMRKLVIQPGSIVTQYEYLKYGVFSGIGAVTIAATVVTTLYTAASDALVSPYLRSGTSTKVMSGVVWKTYANTRAQEESCPRLIGLEIVMSSVCKNYPPSPWACF